MRIVVAALCALALGVSVALAAEPDAKRFAPEAVRSDLDALYRGLQEAHFDLYARTPKEVFNRAYRRTARAIDAPMTEEEAASLFRRFVAKGRVAHARIDGINAPFTAHHAAGRAVWPLAVRVEAGRLYARSAAPGVTPGAEILAINGLSARRTLDRLGESVAADSAYMRDALIELDFAPLMFLTFGAAEAYALTVRGSDGEARRVRVQALTGGAPSASASFDIDVSERVFSMRDGLAYLRPGIFMNVAEGADPLDATAFTAFVDESFTRAIADGARAMLIDLRDNPGGHNAFSDALVAWYASEPFAFASAFQIKASPQALAANEARMAAGGAARMLSAPLAAAYEGAAPGAIVDFPVPVVAPREGARFDRPVYMLVNRRTFSNAAAVAALSQDYGFAKIVGEPTGDLATTYGALERFTLPATGIAVAFPKALIVRPAGLAAPEDVRPDLPVATPILEGPQDPTLKAALAAVAEDLSRLGR